MSRSALRDGVLALSLSNLLMLRTWGLLLKPANHYFLEFPPGVDSLVVTIAATLAIAALLFGLGRILRKGTSAARVAAGRGALVVILLIGLNGLRQQTPAFSAPVVYGRMGALGGAALAVGLSVATFLAFRRWGLRGLSHAAQRIVLTLAPLVPFTLGAAALDLAEVDRDARYHDRSSAARLPKREGPRVLVVVFDGLDQDLLFTNRPTDLTVPAFDALRRSAVSWDQAYPPSCSTLISMPALITGRAISAAAPVAPGELRLAESKASWSGLWDAEPNVFTRARALGVNAALIGWYHPYCRVLGADVAHCRWLPYFRPPEPSVLERSRELATSLIETVPGAYRLRVAMRFRPSGVVVEPGWHIHLYREIHEETTKAVRSGDFDLVFVHYPIPHDPYIYDRRAADFSTAESHTYVDNLALADRTLGELLVAVGESGRSAETGIIVTADHGLRRPDVDQRCDTMPTIGNDKHRVPLLIRLPGQERALERPEVVRTNGMEAAALAILSGTARRAEDMVPLVAGSH